MAKPFQRADQLVVVVDHRVGAEFVGRQVVVAEAQRDARHPGVLRGAVLFRAMVPLVPDSRQPNALAGTRVLISNGKMDPMVPADQTEQLARLLHERGADVEVHWQGAGHQLMPADFAVAKTWLQSIK